MRHGVFFIAAAMAVASCAHGGDGAKASDAAETVNGATAYAEHCAGCHETGMLGAPREGEPQDWEARSSLWQAVLMEHAKTGYFDMPARGGKTHLPDEIVDAAAEFMLEQTFPNRPED
jgi:cytochrome c5